ncbi:MAG: biopolymer transporter ExbD [Bdellovibrionales bacterium]
MGRARKTNLDFEINLLPFISVLAVCISLLLLTAVWVKTGSVNVKQALGTEEAQTGKAESSVWIYFEDNGATQLTVKNNHKLSKSLQAISIPSIGMNKIDVEKISKSIGRIKKSDPSIHIALVLPSANSVYQDVVQVMDSLKRTDINDVGIAPL